MNYDRNNARMIVITDNKVSSEDCSEEVNMASSPHLEMLKIIAKRLRNDGYSIISSNENNVMQLGILVAKSVKGIVIQVLPNPLANDTISLAIYYDEVGLSSSVIENLKKVYSELLLGKQSIENGKPHKPMLIDEAIFFDKADLGAYNNIEKEEGTKCLAVERVISELPVNYIKGRK